MKKYSPSAARNIAFGILLVLVLASIDNSFVGIMRSRQSRQQSKLELVIAPKNLARAAETFRVSVPVEDPGFQIDALTKLRAWATLRNTLSAYTERLELLDAQQQELDRRLQLRSMVTAFAMMLTTGFYVYFTIRRRSEAALAQERVP